jgi:rifampin ADP-ribosylating transferase
MAATNDLSSQRFYHGTRADLKPGDLIEPGYRSNFGTRKKAGYVYLTSSLDAAAWGAELALSEGSGRIYTVEPAGPIMADPNLTRGGLTQRSRTARRSPCESRASA